MLKKRLIGVITVKDGWAVQSFGYSRYLPLGRPEILAENLDRWGADEIILQCIDRTSKAAGPDFDILSRVASKGLGTPLIYAGGISSVQDGIQAIQSGADRIALDALLHSPSSTIMELAHRLGVQALVGGLPVSLIDNTLYWHNYQSKTNHEFDNKLLQRLQQKSISEIMVIDWKHEGQKDGFQINIIHNFPLPEIPIIAFGGLSSIEKINGVLSLSSVSAVAIGNFLNYKEHAIASYKEQCHELPIRTPYTGEV